MPPEISKNLVGVYLNKEIVIKSVYQAPNANTYLATFSKFYKHNRETEYAQKLLKRGLLEFVEQT